MIEADLRHYPDRFRRAPADGPALAEAKKRVLDSIGCFYGAFDSKPARILRDTLTRGASGEATLWGTNRKAPADLAAWVNGTCVRALDFNDTYLSKEPCHPSDLISSFWAACELSGKDHQGKRLLNAMVLGYETLCRLCDATSLRVRGWDHVTYLPIASAVGCSYILGLNEEKTGHAIALAVTGGNAMRQTRVGTISDWKAACAAYAARSGLWAARLAANGFTGPSDVFSGKHGFFAQVSGKFSLSSKPFGRPWKILETHTKFFPAEHHAQSAIEAALQLRNGLIRHPGKQLAGISTSFERSRGPGLKHAGATISHIRNVQIETFDVAVSIIGSEKEKWLPTTRETADHSMPYLVAVALLDGDVNLRQYETGRYLKADVRALMRNTSVVHNKRYTAMYPKKMPVRLTVTDARGRKTSSEVMLPKGYAGRPMSVSDVAAKFRKLSAAKLNPAKQSRLIDRILSLEKANRLGGLL